MLHETNDNFSHYQMKSPDEIMEYMLLDTYDTGLAVDIFVDDGMAYKRNHHPPLLFARNSIDPSVKDYIPFSISDKPSIMADSRNIKITPEIVSSIQMFIVLNKDMLLALANEKIGGGDIDSLITRAVANVGESTILNEMATLRKKDTGLPVDLWIDEDSTFQGHAPRIKFQANSEQHTTYGYSTMLLTNPPVIEHFPRKSNLKKKDLDKIRQFVIDNMDDLLKIARNEMSYRREFLPKMLANRQKHNSKINSI